MPGSPRPAQSQFVVNYRRKGDGLERRYTIGAFPDWSVTAAREEAKRIKREIDGGADPVGKDKADRAAPTVADFALVRDEHVVAEAPEHAGGISGHDAEPDLCPRWAP